MKDFAIELVGTLCGGVLAGFFEAAARHRLRPRTPVRFVPRPGGYWN